MTRVLACKADARRKYSCKADESTCKLAHKADVSTCNYKACEYLRVTSGTLHLSGAVATITDYLTIPGNIYATMHGRSTKAISTTAVVQIWL